MRPTAWADKLAAASRAAARAESVFIEFSWEAPNGRLQEVETDGGGQGVTDLTSGNESGKARRPLTGQIPPSQEAAMGRFLRLAAFLASLAFPPAYAQYYPPEEPE